MARMTAEMIVDLKDRTGASTRAVIGNLNRLKKAERDYALSASGVRLSEKDRRMEQLMIARSEELKARRQRWMTFGRDVAIGTMVAGYSAARAYSSFADLERRVSRIAINADQGASAIAPTIDNLRKVANDTKLPFEAMVTGLETLVASGRSLKESLDFLPSVALTAQASGAEIQDIALSADSLAGSMKISSKEMQKAFDILVAGGKAGKFELKDMAQYLPSLLPAFAALGYTGTEGLQKMVAMLQIVRNQTGDASSAATNLANVFQKMNSQETVGKFKKFGIDLNAELEKAKKNGKDVLDTFLDLTQKATKGDLSKLTLLFNDKQVQDGVRALMTQRDALNDLQAALGKVDGSSLRDFNQIAQDSASNIQEMSNNWDGFVSRLGQTIAPAANTALKAVNEATDYMDAVREGLKKRGMGMAAREAWLFYNLPLGGYSSSQEADQLAFDNGYRGEDLMNRLREKRMKEMRGRGLGFVQHDGNEAQITEAPPPDHGYSKKNMPDGAAAPVPAERPAPESVPQRPSEADIYRNYGRTRRRALLDKASQPRPRNGAPHEDDWAPPPVDVRPRNSAAPDTNWQPPTGGGRARNWGGDEISATLRSAGDDAGTAIAGKMADGGKVAADAMASQAAAIGDAIGSAAARRFMSSINIPVPHQSLGSRPPMNYGGDMSGVHASTNYSGL